MSTTYNATTSSYARSFQVGHGIGAADFAGESSWPTILREVIRRARHGGIDDTIADARVGKPSIAGDDAHRLQWGTYVRGPISHWVAVLGWNGTYSLVMAPISTTGANYIHQMTESQRRYYAATNPGHPQSTAARNSILVR